MVSVIIPCYNASRWIARTIESCLAQKELLKEVIIIDDHSTDNSWEILSRYSDQYPERILVKKNPGKGGNHARNYGYDLCGGDYIQWLDADDLLQPGKFATQLQAFSRDTDIVYSDWQLDTYDQDGRLIRQEYKQHRPYGDFLFELLINNWSPPHNYLLKRSIAERLRRIPAWDPVTPIFQDREYFTLAALEGGKFTYAPGNLIVYNRWNDRSVSANKEKREMFLPLLLSRFLDRVEQRDDLSLAKKKTYRKVILTEKILAGLSGKKMASKDPDLRFGNIYWPLVKHLSTRIKLLLALSLNAAP